MTSSIKFYPLITAGQAAVRAVEEQGSPDTLAGLDKALCNLPLHAMDEQADRVLYTALEAVSRAQRAEEWDLLHDVLLAVSRLLHEGQSGSEEPAPAVSAMVRLLGACQNRSTGTKTPVTRAWDRAFSAGVEVLSLVMGACRGDDVGPKLFDRRMNDFLAAVHRAIPYEALLQARRALVEAAQAYGLFAVGMRQPMPPQGRWEWARRIGAAQFRFEVVPPFVTHPYGSVAVQRRSIDGTTGPVRYFPLGPDEARRRAVTDAQYRI
ncbi:hypothetical protein ABT024_05190 [Streptomyces sp. NPDC002812]|uniref:hypothetical protein n=1 Tax=Streptomyces sp. NPDC002812 TaxID=3154434 RepID=UPI0033260128